MELHRYCVAECQQARDFGARGQYQCSRVCAYLRPELLALAQQAIDAIAWRAYERAWPEAMARERFVVRDCWVSNK